MRDPLHTWYSKKSLWLPCHEVILTASSLKEQLIRAISLLIVALRCIVNSHSIAGRTPYATSLVLEFFPSRFPFLHRRSKTLTRLILCSFLSKWTPKCCATVSLTVSPEPNTLILWISSVASNLATSRADYHFKSSFEAFTSTEWL